jgi:hypothetical protein
VEPGIHRSELVSICAKPVVLVNRTYGLRVAQDQLPSKCVFRSLAQPGFDPVDGLVCKSVIRIFARSFKKDLTRTFV